MESPITYAVIPQINVYGGDVMSYCTSIPEGLNCWRISWAGGEVLGQAEQIAVARHSTQLREEKMGKPSAELSGKTEVQGEELWSFCEWECLPFFGIFERNHSRDVM